MTKEARRERENTKVSEDKKRKNVVILFDLHIL